jgi:hypothetical protein
MSAQSSCGNITAVRRITQIQAYESSGGSAEIFALCDDGSLWKRSHTPEGKPTWFRLDASIVTDSPSP